MRPTPAGCFSTARASRLKRVIVPAAMGIAVGYDRIKNEHRCHACSASHPQDFTGGCFGVYRHTSHEAFVLKFGRGFVRFEQESVLQAQPVRY